MSQVSISVRVVPASGTCGVFCQTPPMAPGLRSGVLRVVISAMLFGVAAPAASRLAGSTSAFTLAGLLYLGAFLAVAPAVLRSPPSKAAMQRAWKPLVIAVVAGGAIGPVLLMAGLARTTAATGSLLLNTELSATAVLAAIFFREHLGRRVLAAVLFITLASALLTWEPSARVDIGALLIIAACVAWDLITVSPPPLTICRRLMWSRLRV